MGPSSNRTGFLWWRGRGTTHLSPCFPFPSASRVQAIWEHNDKTTACQIQRRHQQSLKAIHCSWNSDLPNCEKIRFWCLILPVVFGYDNQRWLIRLSPGSPALRLRCNLGWLTPTRAFLPKPSVSSLKNYSLDFDFFGLLESTRIWDTEIPGACPLPLLSVCKSAALSDCSHLCYCINYTSVVGMRYQDQRQFKEERVGFGSRLQRDRVCNGREGISCDRSRLVKFSSTPREQRKSKQGVRWGSNLPVTLGSTSWWFRTSLNTRTTNWDQVFTHEPMRTFAILTTTTFLS